jgi:hypothetical protein
VIRAGSKRWYVRPAGKDEYFLESVGDRRRCKWPRCEGDQVLTEKPTRLKIQQLEAAETFPQTSRRLNVWICTVDPRKHVEVHGWGLQQTQDCVFEGCRGVMAHYFAARECLPDGSEQPVRKGNYGRIESQSGWLCIEDPGDHFVAD